MIEYKETNIPWIGKIPEDWKIIKVKDGFQRVNEKAKNNNPIVLSLARDGVKIRDISTGEGQLAADYSNYNPVKINDLLLNPMDLYSGANCSLSQVEGVISPAYINLRAKDKIVFPKYYDYYFKIQYWSMALFAHGKGVSYDNRWTLGLETAMNYLLPYPNYYEQEKIANFLDNRISEIDGIIEKTKSTIEDYRKYKQSIITKVVTKGLNKNTEMKDSGIDWIGKIPSNWKIKKLKFCCDTRNQKYSTNYGKLDYFALENIISESGEFIKTQNSYSLDGSIICQKNDIVFGKLRPYLAKVYKCPKFQCCSSEFAVFFNFDGISDFYKYLFLSNWFIKIVDASTYGTKMPRANIDFINNMLIPIPPHEEQIKIVNELDTKIDEINKLIKNKQQFINKIQQYKQSLIYEYVTGKKKVKENV